MSKQILDEWAAEVAAAVGRSLEDIRAKGLSAYDFSPTHDLRINLIDGSFVQFKCAFAVSNKSKRAIAVFTEHCGYHVFPDHEAVVTQIDHA